LPQQKIGILSIEMPSKPLTLIGEALAWRKGFVKGFVKGFRRREPRDNQSDAKTRAAVLASALFLY
jgi:hypothetical protein